MSSRIVDAARRAAEALETRAFFQGDRVTRARGPAMLDVAHRTVRCLVHHDCREAVAASTSAPVVRRASDDNYECTECGRIWSRLVIVAAPPSAGLEELGLRLDTITELRFAQAIGDLERREALRPHFGSAEPPPDTEPLAPPPSWLPAYRPNR